MEVSRGSSVPIPCRACGGALIPFSIDLGEHRLLCPCCGSSTLVRVSDENGTPRIRTEEAPSGPGNCRNPREMPS